jgi:hypothetical protein
MEEMAGEMMEMEGAAAAAGITMPIVMMNTINSKEQIGRSVINSKNQIGNSLQYRHYKNMQKVYRMGHVYLHPSQMILMLWISRATTGVMIQRMKLNPMTKMPLLQLLSTLALGVNSKRKQKRKRRGAQEEHTSQSKDQPSMDI